MIAYKHIKKLTSLGFSVEFKEGFTPDIMRIRLSQMVGEELKTITAELSEQVAAELNFEVMDYFIQDLLDKWNTSIYRS